MKADAPRGNLMRAADVDDILLTQARTDGHTALVLELCQETDPILFQNAIVMARSFGLGSLCLDRGRT